ncbi:unnamed protein product [Bursaphelenchus xylophilus]|uniref:(pine wood nematode) hypothetical protein n=1 Tax=Bursaphelenchus xylophilus TaxID=6326 RepID=A0A7I8XPP0_BURXY|nr:unnamed protein product [Bursaphelenchus xylophilus]CAG9086925.1 unnamed protein product [Bursaphelenchus xylophilus]
MTYFIEYLTKLRNSRGFIGTLRLLGHPQAIRLRSVIKIEFQTQLSQRMSASRVSLLVLLAVLVPSGLSAYARQCACDDLKPCADKISTSLPQCAGYCSPQLTAIGVNLTEADECLQVFGPEFNATVTCIGNEFANSCLKTPSDQNPLIAKRNPDSLKLAVLGELNRWMSKNGGVQLKQTISQTLSFAVCTKKCLDIRTAKCASKFDCALELPSDQAIIDTAKRCINSSWDTEKAQALCSCLAESGFQKLTDACPKITIGNGKQ